MSYLQQNSYKRRYHLHVSGIIVLLGGASSSMAGWSPAFIPVEQYGDTASWVPVPAAGMPQILEKQQSYGCAGSDVCASSGLLQEWLKSLVVYIPDMTTSSSGFSIDIKRGNCTHLGMEDISTSQFRDLLGRHRVDIMAQGLAATCKLHWAMKSETMPTTTVSQGAVSISLNNSMLGGSFFLRSDTGKPRLPGAFQADCKSAIQVTDLQFSESNSSDSMQVLAPAIKSFISTSVASVICEQLNAAASPMLQNANAQLRDFLVAKPTSPSTPGSLAARDYALDGLMNVGQNPGMLMGRQLLDKVLMNPASSHSLSNMSQEFLGPNGTFAVESGIAFLPLTRTIRFPDFADVNVTIDNFTLRGLHTSRLQLSSLSPEQIQFGFGFGNLGVAVNLTLKVVPSGNSPLRGGKTLVEHFDLSTVFRDIYTGASILFAVNQSHLGTLSANQLFSWGCWAPAVQSALELQASLALPSVKAFLTPLAGGSLDKALDGALNAVLGTLLGQFASALDAVGNHAIATTLRDTINTKIQNSLVSPVCPAPVPTFTSHAMFVLTFSICIVLCVVVLALMIFNFGAWGRKALDQGWTYDEPSSNCAVEQDDEQPANDGYTTFSARPSTIDSRDSSGPLLGLSVENSTSTLPSFSIPCLIGEVQGSWDCLAFHPRLPFVARFGLPMLDIAVMCLFIASNSSIGSSVAVDIFANSQPVVQIPSIYDCSLGSSIKDMLEHKVYLLAGIIIIWSGIWPYLKLFMMQFCWFVPTFVVSAEKRLSMLEFLDNWGKWSLIDVFVMVIFMVAFEFEVASNESVASRIFDEAGASGRFSVYVDAKFGFHLFVGATLGSLAVGHVMTAMHRYALQIGEYSLAAVEGNRQRLCNVLRPEGFWSGTVYFVWGPIVAMGVSLALVVIGIWLDTFAFNFEGMSGYILGDKRSRSYSVISLGIAIPAANPTSDSGIVFLTMVYFLSTALVVLAYYSILIVLWCAPLSPRLRSHFFVAAQVLDGFSALEVFVVALFVASLEIQRFALAIVGDKCDMLNSMLSQLPISKDIPGPKTCFDVTSELKAGFWILFVAAAISSVTGRVMIARCKAALLSSGETPRGGSGEASDASADEL